jgi:ParB-like chromosome segregation protein Spo0J
VSDFKLRQVFRPQFRPGFEERVEEQHPEERPSLEPEQPAEREGLPSDYRMRHDRHYVDHLLRAAPAIRLVPTAGIDGGPAVAGEDLSALIVSIARLGLLQPLLVRRQGARYDLIDGRRRLAAAVAAGLAEVPCLVQDVEDDRVSALREAANLRADPTAGPAGQGAWTSDLGTGALSELTGHLEAIGSCLNLFSDRDRPLRERLAKELIQAEVQRAARLSQGLAVLLEERPLTRTAVDVRRLIERVVEAMRPERALARHTVVLEPGPGAATATGDEALLAVALAGALAAMHALVEPVSGAALRCSLGGDPARGMLVVQLTQQSVTLPSSQLARFFDPAWPERPGGDRAAVGLLAARRIVAMHGGTLEVSASAEGAAVLTMELPARC